MLMNMNIPHFIFIIIVMRLFSLIFLDYLYSEATQKLTWTMLACYHGTRNQARSKDVPPEPVGTILMSLIESPNVINFPIYNLSTIL